jgi:hypothetical protein
MNSSRKSFKTTAFSALLKMLLCIFNIIFLCIGSAFLLIGVYGYKMFRDFFSFAPSTAIYIPIVSIGLFMILVGTLSLWCIPKGVTSLLYIYSIIVFLLFLSTFTVSILFIARRDKIEVTFKQGLGKMIKSYPKDKNSVDLLQTSIKCCGTEKYQDWFKTEWANQTNSVPESCCRVPVVNCTHENLPTRMNSNVTDIFTTGCFSVFNSAIENNYGIISIVLLGSSLIILIGCIISCVLATNLRNNSYYMME